MRLPRIASLFAPLLLLAPVAVAQTPLSGPLSDTTTGPLLSGVVYHAAGAISVDAGATLTVQSGAIVKLAGLFTIAGTLDVNGSSLSPVIFTSLSDDTAGGDTNGNGPSSGSPGQWQGIRFTPSSDASTLEWAELRFAGQGGWTGAYLESADVSFSHCTFRASASHGLNANNSSFPSVSDCSFLDNGGAAAANVSIEAALAFTDNSATGNGQDYIAVTGGTLPNGGSITLAHCMNGAMVIAGAVNLPAGQTLDLGPGVVLKFGSSQFTVSGTLLANGTPGSPVVFTVLADDDWGGDSNGDGPSSGAPGTWPGVRMTTDSDASVLQNTIVRFGGQGGWTNLYLESCDASFSSVVSRDSSGPGLNANTGSRPAVSGCSFLDNGGVAIANLAMDALPNFSANTASGNGGNYTHVSAASPSGSQVILKDNFLGPALVLESSLSVPNGATLTLEAGVVLKFKGGQFTVNGTLEAIGSSSDKIVITLFTDDEFGGDTNQNGASSGSPGAWNGMRFTNTSDASVLEHVVVRYGGQGGWSNLYLESADISLTSCISERCATTPLNLTHVSKPSVNNCQLLDSGGVAVGNAPIDALPNFNGNVATGNAGGDWVYVTATSPTGDLTLTPDNLLNAPGVMANACTIPSGTTTTLAPGVVLKFAGGQLIVNGTLLTQGDEFMPVVLTVFADDDWGGDTNGNGPSTGVPGAWQGLLFTSGSDSSVLKHTTVRFGGLAGWSNFYLVNADITLRDCVSRDCATTGMNLVNSSRPDVRYCSFDDNGGVAIDAAPLAALPGFSHNAASGNAQGDYLRATSLDATIDVDIERHQLIGDVLVLSNAGTIAGARRVRVAAGITLKLQGSGQLVVNGGLDVLGTQTYPVVITLLTDDTVAGDTNKDGNATTPVPGSWPGLRMASVLPSQLRNLEVRYAGWGGEPALQSETSSVTLDVVRTAYAQADGFNLIDMAAATHLTAWSCGRDGVRLIDGGADVLHISSVGNAQWGVNRFPSYTGVVVNTISWGNGAGNYQNFGAGDLRYSNGDAILAGGDGNIDLDPLFADAPGGDLTLLPGSPSIDAGDPATGLDPDASLRDQGAYFSDPGNVAPSSYCTGKLTSVGCTPYVDWVGQASASSPLPFEVLAFNEVNKKVGLLFYGTSGGASIPFQGGLICVGSPVTRTLGQFSGGNPAPDDCSGRFTFDFNAYIQSGASATLVPGAEVRAQYWGRDINDPFGSSLSNALRFVILP